MNERSDWADSHWIGVFAAGLAALLAVRLGALTFNQTDLFFDEAQYWYWSLEPAFGYYSKPPLIGWIVRVATESCGLSEFCIRLPSPILHTLTATVVMAIGSYLYDLRTGAICGLVFATLPGVSLSAPVNDPRTCPKSSDSIRASGMAPQFTATKG